jgi:hypothetical protein
MPGYPEPVTRHRPRGRTLIVLVLGALAVLGAVAVDPAALTFLLDVDFLIAIGSAGLLMLGTDGRVLARRLVTSTPGILLRAGASLTRARPDSLLP